MERAGYSPAAYNRFRDLGLDTDFYVENQMKNPAFSKEWRLFYPADL
jgi:hypothetical protein